MTGAAPFPFPELVDDRWSRNLPPGNPGAPAQKPGPRSDRHGRSAVEPSARDPAPASEPERVYTPDELAKAVDEACRTAVQEAEAKLRATMASDLEQRRVDLLAAIRDQLAEHRSAYESELSRLAETSRRLGLALAEALIPHALAKQPLADVADVLRAVMARLAKEPSIELRLSPDLAEAGEALLAGIAKDAGFPGDVATVADDALAQGDAELRWRGGAVERRTDRLLAEARDLVERWLPAAPEAADPAAASPPPPSPEASTKDVPSDREAVGAAPMSEPCHEC